MKKALSGSRGKRTPKTTAIFYMNETKIINRTKNSMKNTHACTY